MASADAKWLRACDRRGRHSAPRNRPPAPGPSTDERDGSGGLGQSRTPDLVAPAPRSRSRHRPKASLASAGFHGRGHRPGRAAELLFRVHSRYVRPAGQARHSKPVLTATARAGGRS